MTTAMPTSEGVFAKMKKWWKRSESARLLAIVGAGVAIYVAGGDLLVFMLFLFLAGIAVTLFDIRNTLAVINYRLKHYGGDISGLDDLSKKAEDK